MELYRKMRPKSFDGMIGNDKAIRSLKKILAREDRPHSFLFVGPPGCGKTTLAYILARELGVTDENLEEANSGAFRGIDTARDYQRKMQLSAIGGGCRVFIIEEAHKLTPDAQEALLKPIENCPNHVYFLFTTTNPEKLNTALKTRLVTIQVEPLIDDQITLLVTKAAKKSGSPVSIPVAEKISRMCDGSARRALTMLENVLGIEDEKEQLDGIVLGDDEEALGIDLCRRLMRRPKPDFKKDIAPILAKLKEDPEGVRRAILGYMNSVMLKSGNTTAYLIMTAFRDNYFNTGRAGLTMSCWEALQAD